jgi:adenine deaminase
MILLGQIVDIKNRRIYKGEITIEKGKITAIEKK